MEHPGSYRELGIRSAELAEVARWPGPVLSVLLTTEGGTEEGVQRAQMRWQVRRERLAMAGADESCLMVVDDLLPDAPLEGDALVVLATPQGRVHVEHEAVAPMADRLSWSSVPSLTASILWRQRTLPYLVVCIDHRGADIVTVSRRQPRHRVVAGARDYPLTKVGAGGWSQRRYQQRAENTWRDNAREAASAVANLADEIAPELVLVAGDDKARHLLLADLPAALADRVRLVPGSRAADGSDGALDAEVDRQVRSRAAERTTEVLEAFRSAHGQARRAAEGPSETVAALAEARVDVLLVHDDDGDERRAWIGPSAGQVALDETSLMDLGVARPERGRLIDVAVTEAFRSGAAVAVVPFHGGPAEGIGAILRWPDRHHQGNDRPH